MTIRRAWTRRAVLGSAWVVAISVAAPAVRARFDPQTDRETLLVSRTQNGLFPNGPSRNGAISQDRQLARFLAFESDATNIVPGDSNGFTDVFLVRRARPYGRFGSPWRPGPAKLVSVGRGRRPANGPSYRPDLGGDQTHHPRCIAFVSAASNLVRGDTNGKPDAFVRKLSGGRIRRVSVSSTGAQSNGTTFDVKVDGACNRVAFTSNATNLALRKTRRRAWRGAVTSRPHGRTRQVYVRVLEGRKRNRRLKGLTFLASSSNSRRAGRGHSFEPSFARSGRAVSFTSFARNLSRRDRSARSDVYKRSFPLVDGSLRLTTTLVSATRRGRAGSGASGQSAINESGRYVAYTTAATNLLPRDRNRRTDVVRADTWRQPPTMAWVSRSAAVGEQGDGASGRPTIARPGTPVFFESESENLQPFSARNGVWFDRNGTGDIFFWNSISRNVSLQSRDSENQVISNFYGYYGQGHRAAAAKKPATSYYGNYVLFESSYPLIDLGIVRRQYPALERDPQQAARLSQQYERLLNQVYLRYIGPA